MPRSDSDSQFSSKVGNTSSRRPDATGLVPTRTDDTLGAYRKRARQLMRMAAREMGVDVGPLEAVLWISEQDGRWKKNTVHTYRASLRTVLSDGLEDGDLSENTVARLSEILEAKIAFKTGGVASTSARKAKTYSPADFARLISALDASPSPDDRLAAKILAFNTVLFLRPCEWFLPRIEGNKLIVRAAKTTNGRGIGTERSRTLKDWSPAYTDELRELLETLKKRVPMREEFDILIVRLSARIAYKCKTLDIPRLSIYGTRHVGTAAAKQVMSADEVAACAGHKTARTSTSKYAPRRSGWLQLGKQIPGPTSETLARVQPTSRWSRELHMSSRSDRLSI